MAEVLESPSETLDRRPSPSEELPPPPPPPPLPPRRRDRDSRDRRDDRDDRPPNRRDDYNDSRNRSPPPRGDRNRDYRARGSYSPPPYGYRDRRHSPPRRSPPPGPPKRARRDDGGYDRRQGSPRGGYGMDDRRLGHDYDGYERRGPGNRSGYGEERSHGRFYNRQSDWHDSGRGGLVDSTDVIQREGLMSYKQFIQELEDDVLPSEAERRYEEYRSEYISTQKRAYFEAHKEEQWLKDKYHPTHLVSYIERRNEQARNTAKEFLLDLQSGPLDLGPGLTAPTASKSENGSEPNSDDEAEPTGKRRRHAQVSLKENDMISAAPKAHPVSSDPRRIQIDIEQAQALVRKLDTEKGIQDNILSSSDSDNLDSDKSRGRTMGPIIIIRGLSTVKGLEGVELLDTLITYLWRVHGLDYYGMSESNEAKGLRHVRTDGKNSDGSNANASSGSEWEKKLDSFWQERLHAQDPLEVLAAKDKIDASANESLDPCVRKIRDEKYGWKYGCGAKGCTKLFHAPEFVYKHLKLKHPELVLELTSKVREDLYFQNYMGDSNAPGSTPVMQQSFSRSKIPRRRPVFSNRLRDDRANRREDDNDNGSERANIDEAMYDAFGGQGLPGAPFSSEIAPPILMPVPGAGPLGPFVPAPPEVAMHMLRDQGPPSSFEANGGRNGRAGPQMTVPAPIIPFPPTFRQDPRRLRSYQDLDAPEDEVTVIDYRSF